MTAMEHQERPKRGHRERSVDPISVAVLIVAVVSFGLMLTGVLGRGTTPLALIIPIALAIFAVATFRK